jgi:hypothetical protein
VLRSWPFPRGWLPLPGDGPVETDVVSGIRYLVGSKSYLFSILVVLGPFHGGRPHRNEEDRQDRMMMGSSVPPFTRPRRWAALLSRRGRTPIASHRIPSHRIPIPPLEADRPDLSFGPRLMSERRCGRPSFLLPFFLLPFHPSHHFLSPSPCCRGFWIWYPIHAAPGVLSRGSEMPFPPMSNALYVWTLNTRSLPKSYLEAPPSSILRLCGMS